MSQPFRQTATTYFAACKLFLTLRLSAVILSLALVATAAAQDLTAPGPSEQKIIAAFRTLLERDHFSQRKLDDEISRRALNIFLESLDPLKLYFYQADVNEFLQSQDKLDDMIRRMDVTLAHQMFNRFLLRVDERVAMADDLLEMPHEFHVEEELIKDRDLRNYPAEETDARELWRKRIKYDLLVQKSEGKEDREAIDNLRARYRYYQLRMHQFDNDELLEMYLSSISQSYDPHSTYMSRTTIENFNISMSLQLQGIGAALRSENGVIIVTKIIAGGAADRHGKLNAKDRIISVGQGEEGPLVDVRDRKLNDVVQLVRGEAGTVVRLGVCPFGNDEVKVYSIERAEIKLVDSEAGGQIIEEGTPYHDRPIRIGVIALPSFYMDIDRARAGHFDYKSTSRDVRKILDEFTVHRVDLVIVDLRRNGGGSLTEAIDCTGLFIDRGPVVQVENPDGQVRVYGDRNEGVAWNGPLLVLTSHLSASASEIFAGAIQDYRRGIIVGDESTHGKGTVQHLYQLGELMIRQPTAPPNWGALKLTVQQFYRPNGHSTQSRGVLADIILPSIVSHMDVGESDLDFALEFNEVPPAHYQPVNMTSDRLLSHLQQLSDKRRNQSDDWRAVDRQIEKYQQQKARQAVSLNEETFFARRSDLDAAREEDKALDAAELRETQDVVQRDFYFNEVISIAVDYLKALDNDQFGSLDSKLP